MIIDLWFTFVSEPSKQCITFRPINNINIDNLCRDLEQADLLINPKSKQCELVSLAIYRPMLVGTGFHTSAMNKLFYVTGLHHRGKTCFCQVIHKM